MRNLKRALSLGLTAAMISGLMVMGSSAASYADVTSENNQEAIDVLQTVGIMVGDENGNFNPDQNVTRNEMAVIMANLMEYNVATYKDTSPFTDVPSWAEPYVAACYTNGITSGYSDTIYGGSDTVTTAQAALMLMKALGYFQYASDFGGDWQLATTRQGNAIDLFTGVDSGVTQAMTRNDVAQLVLNTLRSGTVEASTDGSWTIGDVTINNNVRYSYITSNQDYADAIDDVKSTSNTTDANRYVVELGEQLYQGDLELNDNATDVFGRPARTWSYDSKEIGTYAKTELLKQSYTTKVTGRELYDLLGSNVVDAYDVKVTIDGVTDHDINNAIFNETAINRNNKAGVGATGNGVLTEVYVDQENKLVDIAIINTYLAIAADDYSESQEEVSLDVYGVAEKSDEFVKTQTDDEDKISLEVSSEDFDVTEVVDGDVMLVTLADGEVQSIGAPETLSAVEISSFKVGDSLTADGTDYDYADSAEYDVATLEAWTDGDTINLKDMTYNVYLDQYGYAIGVVEVEEPDNYLFITGLDGNYNNLANATYEANAIFMDGTMDVITIDSRKSDFEGNGIDFNGTPFHDDSILEGNEDDATVNAWFTYTVNSKDVYTVKLVDINAGMNEVGQSVEDRGDGTENDVIDYKHDSTTDGFGNPDATKNNRVYGNDETVYLTASIDDIKTGPSRTDVVIDDVDSVVVGIDNVDIQPWDYDTVEGDYPDVNGKLSHGIYTLYDEDGYIIAMVAVGEDNGANDALVYVHSGSVARESYDKTTEEWTWTRTAIDGATGEEITLTEVNDSGISMLDDMDENNWYRVRFNVDNEVTRVSSDNADIGGVNRPDYDNDFDDFWDLFDNTGNTYTGPANVPYAYVYQHAANEINAAINIPGVDTVLYHEDFNNPTDKPTNSGKTLYVTQDLDAYIRFTDDTVVVFEQMNNNEWDTEFWAGQSGVERALRELRLDDTLGYEISAVIEDGRATTIIIHDESQDGDSGNWTESNMVTNEDKKFRLWGYNYSSKNPDLYGAEAEAIAYTTEGAFVDYSFYVYHDADNDGKPNYVPNGTKVTYDLRVISKGDYLTTWHCTGIANANGLVSDTHDLANRGEQVDIYIENVKPDKTDVPTVPEGVTVSIVGDDVYVDGAANNDEAVEAIKATLLNAPYNYSSVDVTGESIPGVPGEYKFTFKATKTVSGTPVTDTYTYDTTTGDVAPITVTVDGVEKDALSNAKLSDLDIDPTTDGFVTVNGEKVDSDVAVKDGDVILTGLASITGTNGTVYGEPGEKIGEAASEAMAGNYLKNGTAIKDVVFGTGTAGTDNKVTDDNYFSFIVYEDDGTSKETFQKAGTKISISSADPYALVNDKIVDVTEYNAAANTVQGDTVIVKGYVELTVTDDADTEVLGENSIAWGKGVVEQDGKFYAQKGAKVTLTLTTAEFTVETTDHVLKVGAYGAGSSTKLTEVDFEKGNLGTYVTGSTDKEITFGAGETYQPGTIVVELTVGTANTNVGLEWQI